MRCPAEPESFLFLIVVLFFVVMLFVIVMMPHFVFMLLVFVLFLLHGAEQRRFGVARYFVVIGLAANPSICQAMLSVPPSSRNEPLPASPLSAQRRSSRPLNSSGTASGMRPVCVSTTPPIDPEPYSSVPEPLNNSTRSAMKGSTVTA